MQAMNGAEEITEW